MMPARIRSKLMGSDPVTERRIAVHHQDGADAQAQEKYIEHGHIPQKLAETLGPDDVKKPFVIR